MDIIYGYLFLENNKKKCLIYLCFAPPCHISTLQFLCFFYFGLKLQNVSIYSTRIDLISLVICQFCTAALEHSAKGVRELAASIILSLYEQHRGAVLSYLPPNDASTQKNFLYKTLFDGFGKIDGKTAEPQANIGFFKIFFNILIHSWVSLLWPTYLHQTDGQRQYSSL